MGGKRVFELILEIGHKSTPLNKKLANGYTHKWTAFVRGVNNSKIDHCIQRVVFQLHESFANPYRDITESPFQIKETGYAGFEIPIQIYFKNREKPNHLVFVHDLCLLTNKPNDASTVEKIKFINPNREFEKCLIKSGAQLLNVAVKKERSDSPPAKKQKSSSLIPSKDMSKQPQAHSKPELQPQLQQQSQHAHQKSSQQNHSNSNHQSKHHHHHHHHHHHQQQHQPPPPPPTQQQQQQQQQHQSQQQLSQPHQQQSSHKPKASSKEFIDMFGAPLVYNKNQKIAPHNKTNNREEHREEQLVNDLQLIQTKISCLSDCDRLQRIVDIVEEAGEWYNLTPKKFEFDLKRLDKRTLSKIERCLQH